MPRFLQLQWTDETEWKTVEIVEENREDKAVLDNAYSLQAVTDRRYDHDFTAIFRIVEMSYEAAKLNR